ncbi:MAG: HdeD family acid-resistance protein [Gammaproteobacteria bacterium]
MKLQQEPVRGIFTPRLGDLEKNWTWMMGLGIAFLVLGTIGLGIELLLTIASVLLFGVLLLVAGGFQLVHAFLYCKGWNGIASHITNAVLYLAVGMLIVNDPYLASTLLTLIIGVGLIVVGIFRGVYALQNRGTAAWSSILFSGILTILIGFMILSNWPASGLWAIGLFIALELIIAGWSYVFVALSVRKIARNGNGQAKV